MDAGPRMVEEATDARTDSVVYVYAVGRSGDLLAPAAEGVGGARVGVVEADGLVALVSLLPGERLRVRRRDLVRHLGVLEAAFAETTIAPCAFGTALGSEEAVRTELLEARRDELLDLLDRLDGRLQLNVKAAYDEDIVLREILATNPEIRRLSERTRGAGAAAYHDRIRLGELVAAAVAARRDGDARRALDRLSQEAEDVVVEQATSDLVLRASFLVGRNRAERFDAALEALAREEGPRLRFESIGPLPPTAFASVAGPEG